MRSKGSDHSGSFSGSFSGSWSESSEGGGRRRRHGRRVREHVEVVDHGPWGGEEVIVHREYERDSPRRQNRRHSNDDNDPDW